MLIGELMHRIFRAPKLPPRPTSHSLSEIFDEKGAERYSVRHLERFFLLAFVWFLSLLLFMTHEKSSVLELYLSVNLVPLVITIIASVGVWWAFRRGTLR